MILPFSNTQYPVLRVAVSKARSVICLFKSNFLLYNKNVVCKEGMCLGVTLTDTKWFEIVELQ